MNAGERRKFVSTFWPGIVFLLLDISYSQPSVNFVIIFLLSCGRHWVMVGSPEIFTATEIPVSLAVLAAMGSLMLIKKNHVAFMVNHFIIFFGMVLIGVSTILFQYAMITPPVWMILIGTGLYFGYVSFNSIFFDRLLATFNYVGTVGFLIYVVDAFGYLGSIGVLFLKEFGYADLGWIEFFISAGYTVSILGSVLILGSMGYFYMKHQRRSRKENVV